jgi:hypothetical protein
VLLFVVCVGALLGAIVSGASFCSCEDGELGPIVPSQPSSVGVVSADSPTGPAWLGGAASSSLADGAVVVVVVVGSAASPAGPEWLGGAATSPIAVVVGAE